MTNQLGALRRYFDSGATFPYDYRKEQLRKLKQAVLYHEQDLYDALYTDLKKGPEEVWATETGLVIAELNAALKYLRRWMEPESLVTNLMNLPSSSRLMKEPLGVVLIIGTWNYPFQLLIIPMVGAIAAGNCVVLKPSEFAPATNAVMRSIVEDVFPKDYVLYVEGDGASVIPAMMKDFRFDHIFYTGSTGVGRIIYQLAAEKLIPVTLELGGKNPCIVESDADIKVAARRIAMTKFSNAGQMCVAPDYILVHQSKKDALILAMQSTLKKFFGEKPEDSEEYGRIINEKQFDRIVQYLSQGTTVYGGRTDRQKLFIEPTILINLPPDSTAMKDEIFGPVLPITAFETAEEAKAIINKNPHPLAFYVFTSSRKKEKEWLESVSFGGGCVNNASWHFTNHHLPFGGRGTSGIGNYHGKHSFETFSHKKAVMKTPTWFDPALKYAPLKGKLKLFKWLVR